MATDEWWFEPANHDRIDLMPEKKRYEPGETAKFQVRMPFREATVLVTVEREGVLSQRVVQLDGKSPVIEVPIIGSYGPNVFVSALAVRGRVDPEVPGPYAWLKRRFYRIGKWLGLVDEVPMERDTRPTALVDLAQARLQARHGRNQGRAARLRAERQGGRRSATCSACATRRASRSR